MNTEEVTEMEVWKERVSQDISDIKQRQRENENALSTVKSDIHKLQVTVQLQDKEISSLKETLSEIKEDTKWIRRRITGAIITAIVTATITGVIGIAIANIF